MLPISLLRIPVLVQNECNRSRCKQVQMNIETCKKIIARDRLENSVTFLWQYQSLVENSLGPKLDQYYLLSRTFISSFGNCQNDSLLWFKCDLIYSY